MGIRIDGNNDLIKAVDDTLTIEGISINTVGLMTATGGVKVGTAATIHSTGQFNIGVAHTLFANGNATHSGIVTASSFVGSGANLTGITQTTITNNANNRVVTGSDTSNTLIAETGLTYDTQTLLLNNTSANPQFHLTSAANGLCEVKFGDANDTTRGNIVYRNGTSGEALCFHGYNNTERMRVTSDGGIGIGTTNPYVLNEPAKFNELTIGGKTEGAAIHLRDDNGNVQGGLFTSDATGAMIVRTITNHPLMFRTNNTDIARFDSSGRLLIGTTTEGESTADDLTIATSSNTGITIRSGTSNEGNIFFSDGTSGADEYRGTIQYNHGSNFLTIGTNGSERLRVDSDGKLKIGTTATPTQSGAINVFGTGQTESQISIRRGSDDSGGPVLHFQKSRNTTDGSHTVVQSGDKVGSILFAGNDAGGPENAARITAEVDSTPGGNDMPGRLVFSTTPDGSDTETERVRIDRNGQLVLSNGNLSTAYGNCIVGGTNLELDTTGIIKFRTDTNQKASITDNGLCFGSDSAAANALDDYEEGSWTPTVHDGTISTGVCKYTKVGRLVTIVAKVLNFSDNSTNDAVRIQSLPFTPAVVDCMAGTLMGSYLGQPNSSALYLADTNQLIAYGQHSGAFDNLRHNELSVSSGSTVLYIVATYMAS